MIPQRPASFLTSFAAILVVSMACRDGSGQTVPRPGGPQPITPAQAKARADEIVKDLHEAAAEAKKIGDRGLRERIELRLSRAELNARELAEELSRARPAAAVAPKALTGEEFDRLLQGLKKESFDKDKLIYVENFARTRPLTCRQAAALLKTFSFDDGRVQAVRLIYPVLLDRQNFPDVLAAFDFDIKKAEARKAVGLK